MAPAPHLSERPPEPGVVLGVSLIAILVALLVGALVAGVQSGPIEPGLGSVLLGSYIVAWGLMFLLAYFFHHKTFFLRALIWVCEHASRPPGRFMAFFYAALAIGLGGFGLLRGLDLI